MPKVQFFLLAFILFSLGVVAQSTDSYKVQELIAKRNYALVQSHLSALEIDDLTSCQRSESIEKPVRNMSMPRKRLQRSMGHSLPFLVHIQAVGGSRQTRGSGLSALSTRAPALRRMAFRRMGAPAHERLSRGA